MSTDIDASARALRHPVASGGTALAYLVQLGVQHGLDRALAAASRGDVLDVAPCPFRGSLSSLAISNSPRVQR